MTVNETEDDRELVLTSGPTNPISAEEMLRLLAIQHKYEELVEYFGLPETGRASREAMALHERILRIIRGEEADPRVG